MRIKSFAFLNSGKRNIAKLLLFHDDPHGYFAIGAGDSNKSPSSHDSPLLGENQCWKPAERRLIETSDGEYIAEWSAQFHYGEISSNKICEVAISRNTTNGTCDGLIRATVDEIKLSPGSVVTISIRISPRDLKILI